MMQSKWRLLDTGVLNAPSNMALEKVLLKSCAEGIAPNTLHLLEFFPCVLLGYNQSMADEVDGNFCRENNIEINRRISGGGSIYMDGGTLGWEIIAKKNTPGIPENLNEMYSLLCGGIIRMLSKYGINASYRAVNDVEVNGRKISGAGGTELEDSFIFHGTVLVDFHADIMVKALKLPLKKLEDKQVANFKMRTVCMRELLGVIPPMAEVKSNLTQAFAGMLGIEFEKAELCREEAAWLGEELPLFSSGEWTRGRQPGNSSLNTYEHKAEGGLIRVSLMLDKPKAYIKSAFISGDFFAYPVRDILALENTLKNTQAKPEVIAKKVSGFFASGNIRIPGACADDFIHAVVNAAQI